LGAPLRLEPQTLAKRRRDDATRAARDAQAAVAKAEKEALEAEAEAAAKDESDDEEEEGSAAQTGVCARERTRFPGLAGVAVVLRVGGTCEAWEG